MKKIKRICVVIPAYNEEKNVGKVVSKVKSVLESLDCEYEIVVVDDGSRDNTAEVAENAGAKVLRHKVNRGKGAASLTGWYYAIEKGFNWAIIMDADGQHSPSDVLKFIRVTEETSVDMILPRRKFDIRTMGFWRLSANVLQSWLASIRTGKRIHDSQCGLRMFRIKVLRKVLRKIRTTGFELETEILILALRYGFSFVEVPVETIYFKGRRSRINTLPDILRYLLVIIISLSWG